MNRKCFISFKKEDEASKLAIQRDCRVDMIDRSLDEAIDSVDEDYIMRRIREDYLSDSTVTIHLIGLMSGEHLGYQEQRYIKRELQASLYDGEGNSRSGILGVVLPSMYDKIFRGGTQCVCGSSVSWIDIGDRTTVSEFHQNYYIPPVKCHYTEDDRYCVLVSWEQFMSNPNHYIEQAFQKRMHPIAQKVTVRPESAWTPRPKRATYSGS